jgi:hypothetical protein
MYYKEKVCGHQWFESQRQGWCRNQRLETIRRKDDLLPLEIELTPMDHPFCLQELNSLSSQMLHKDKKLNKNECMNSEKKLPSLTLAPSSTLLRAK